jgi:hypothetical protein
VYCSCSCELERVDVGYSGIYLAPVGFPDGTKLFPP